MSKKTIIFAIVYFLLINANAQTKKPPVIVKAAQNLFYGKNTYKKIALSDGVYQIFRSPSGRLYINRISKVGEVYVEYIN